LQFFDTQGIEKLFPNASAQNVRGGLYPELGFMTVTP